MLSSTMDRYQMQAINTASKEELTLMLYNGCLKFINIAQMGLEERNIEKRNNNIQKAQAIIAELMITLNAEFPISKNLYQLYDFVQDRLVEANITQDPKALSEAKEIISDLRDTWKEAMKIARMNK